jgi:hypothetical protein
MSYRDRLATDMADYFTRRPDFTALDVAAGTPRLTRFRTATAGRAGLTPGRIRIVGSAIRPHQQPAEAERIYRLMDRLPGGLDEETAANGRISELYMDSVRLAARTGHRDTAYRRAQARLYGEALAAVREGNTGEDG